MGRSAGKRRKQGGRIRKGRSKGSTKAMDHEKRNFLWGMISLAVAVPLASFASQVFARQGTKQQSPFPPRPGETAGGEDLPKIDPKLIQERNQRQIQKNVAKLFSLAEELKTQVEKTDSTSVLSLALVQKAKAIEKLARQIATLAVG